MAAPLNPGFHDIEKRVGQELPPTSWHTIAQADINTFADVTGDWQWIHTDIARAVAESPFGTTIAHGFLTLSLLSKFQFEAHLFPDDARQVINYGLDRVRFVSPVRPGDNVRARFAVLNVQSRADGSKLIKCSAVVEIETSDRPALVAEILSLLIPPATGETQA